MLSLPNDARRSLYVGNMTKQLHQFEFRLPNQRVPRRVDIEALTQVNIAGSDGLTGSEIEQIVKQHERYGLIPVSEIDHTKPYFGLVYSTDKPITVANFHLAIKHNDDAMMEMGKEIRKRAAVATAATLQNSNDLKQLRAELGELEMSVVEQETKSNPDPEFAEGVVVREPNAEIDSATGKRQPRASRRSR